MIKSNSIINVAKSDTLLADYSGKWEGASEASSNIIIQFMSSNDLIFVVLAVSLIIWLVLAVYMVKVDRKISKLEEKYSNQNDKELES